MNDQDAVRRALATALLSGAVPEGIDGDALVDDAIRNRVAPLLASRARQGLSGDALETLNARVRANTLVLAVLDDELRRVLAELARRQVTVTVIKGAHLAHAVYPDPALRPRADTDLLVRETDRDACADVLRACGYSPALHTRGRVVHGQFHLERTDTSGLLHALDVHWRLGAPLIVERLLPCDTIMDASRPVPPLGAHARGPSMPDALALACVHVAAHHWPAIDLLWLWDVHAIAGALTRAERATFVTRVRDGAYRRVAAAVLGAAGEAFPSEAIDALIASVDAGAAPPELSARFLAEERGPAGDLLLDLRVGGWRAGARLVREHVLPDRGYMRAAFGNAPLPIAYAVRAWRGARRWLAVSGGGRKAGRA